MPYSDELEIQYLSRLFDNTSECYKLFWFQAIVAKVLRGKDWNISEQELATRINRERRLIYYFNALNGMETTICVQEEWCQYIRKNQEIVKGWLQYNMIIYLQKRNPSVPGIADKLYPPQERKLEKVKKYWRLLLRLRPMQEIYGHTLLSQSSSDISIDHFVPWSFVAHDELWNLHPTTRSINSSKSNYLPDWDTYFKEFARVEYGAYELVWKSESVHTEFEKCAKDHLNNVDIRYRLYREGQDFPAFSGQLENVIRPVYQSALNCGFDSWIYHGEQNEPDSILL